MRTFTNKPGVVYDEDKTSVIFAEDMNFIADLLNGYEDSFFQNEANEINFYNNLFALSGLGVGSYYSPAGAIVPLGGELGVDSKIMIGGGGDGVLQIYDGGGALACDLGPGYFRAADLTLPHMVRKSYSNNVRHSSPSVEGTLSSTYVALKTFTFPNGLVGDYKIAFDMKIDVQTGGVFGSAKVEIGQGAFVSEEYSTDVDTYSTIVLEAEYNIRPGESMILYGAINDDNRVFSVRNFEVSYDDNPQVAVACIAD